MELNSWPTIVAMETKKSYEKCSLTLFLHILTNTISCRLWWSYSFWQETPTLRWVQSRYCVCICLSVCMCVCVCVCICFDVRVWTVSVCVYVSEYICVCVCTCEGRFYMRVLKCLWTIDSQPMFRKPHAAPKHPLNGPQRSFN